MVSINYLAVLVAALAQFFLGWVWYGMLFSRQWVAWMGMTEERMKAAMAQGVGLNYGISFVGSLLMSYVLAHFIIFAGTYMNVSGVSAGMVGGFWSWLGFIVPVSLGAVLWEGKSWSLYFLNNSYHLISLLVMGLIIGAWM